MSEYSPEREATHLAYTQEFTAFQGVRTDGPLPEQKVTLGYDTDDPLAVTLEFHTDGGPNLWLLSRELLRQGLACEDPYDRVGEGAVTIGHGEYDRVWFYFRGDKGNVVYYLGRTELVGFLSRTDTLVPSGQESSYMAPAIELELQDIINTTGAAMKAERGGNVQKVRPPLKERMLKFLGKIPFIRP